MNIFRGSRDQDVNVFKGHDSAHRSTLSHSFCVEREVTWLYSNPWTVTKVLAASSLGLEGFKDWGQGVLWKGMCVNRPWWVSWHDLCLPRRHPPENTQQEQAITTQADKQFEQLKSTCPCHWPFRSQPQWQEIGRPGPSRTSSCPPRLDQSASAEAQPTTPGARAGPHPCTIPWGISQATRWRVGHSGLFGHMHYETQATILHSIHNTHLQDKIKNKSKRKLLGWHLLRDLQLPPPLLHTARLSNPFLGPHSGVPFFMAEPCGIWDLRSSTRDQTHASCIKSVEC